ncbi:helix-turn-helix transcriptional regulator [Streptomyces sp. NBC_01231]|nr:helix-turn-helix transcriptional regulator [Streptomyces sp. NBC_01231]
MTSDAHLNGLGEFLEACRAQLSPRTVGLPESRAPRRVPGLRREEVAQLSGISTDRYTRLEQGRAPVPTSVLATLVRVLHLDDEQRDHLFALAAGDECAPRRRRAQKVQPQLRRLLDELAETRARPGASHRNYARLVFTDRGFRELYPDWRTIARSCVAHLRLEAAKCPGDPWLAALVGELSVADADFTQWWAGRQVPGLRVGTKRLRHPVAGALTLDWDSLTSTADPAQQLVIMTPEPGTPSQDGLRFLASWTAAPYQRAWDATA